MPVTTQVASWSLSNLGPVTTTFTPAAPCSTEYNVLVGEYLDFPKLNNETSSSTSFVIRGNLYSTTYASWAGCVPYESKLDSAYADYTSTDSGIPNTQYTLAYYSPGLICPSGYTIVGTATRSTGGAVSSSGPAFVPSTTIGTLGPDLPEEVNPNVLLQYMLDGESAILCCPRFACTSLFGPRTTVLVTADEMVKATTAEVNGLCMSALPDYPIPSTICVDMLPNDDIDMSAFSTRTIFGSVYTRIEIPHITGTLPWVPSTLDLATETVNLHAAESDMAVADVVAVLYLVHAASDTAGPSATAKPSDTATASSNATGETSVGTTSKTGLSTLAMLLTISAALTSGVMMLVL